MAGAITGDFLGGGGELGPSAAKAPPLTAEEVARAAVAREQRAKAAKDEADAKYFAMRAEDAARSQELREWLLANDPEYRALHNKQHSAGIDWGLLPAAAKITAVLVATAATGGLAAPAMGTLYTDAKKIAASIDSPQTALATAQDAVAAVDAYRAKADQLQAQGRAALTVNATAGGSVSAAPTVTVRSAPAPAAPAPAAPPAPPVPSLSTDTQADNIWALYAKANAEAVALVQDMRAAAAKGNAAAQASLALLTAAEKRANDKATAKLELEAAVAAVATAGAADNIWALYSKGNAEAVKYVQAIRTSAATGHTKAKAALKNLQAAEQRAAEAAAAAAELEAAVAAVATAGAADNIWALYSGGGAPAVRLIQVIQAAAATGHTKAKAALKNLQAAEQRAAAAAAAAAEQRPAAAAAAAPPMADDSPARTTEHGFVITAAGRILEGSEWHAGASGVLGTLIRTTGPAALRMDATEQRWVRS